MILNLLSRKLIIGRHSSSTGSKSRWWNSKILKIFGMLKNATIAVPLKYLNNFSRSLEIPLINCKIKQNLNGQNIVF